MINSYLSSLKLLDKENMVIDKRLLSEIHIDEIDIVLIGDNPGKIEKRESKYFSENGSAGKFAKSFIDLLKSSNCGLKEIILLNKSPYYSGTTKELEVKTDVLKSIDLLTELIIKIKRVNPNLKILIIGLAKNNLNKAFYPKLFEKCNNSLNNIYFLKHFSFGHFHNQFIENLIGNIFQSTIDIENVLSNIHLKNVTLINKNFKTNFK